MDKAILYIIGIVNTFLPVVVLRTMGLSAVPIAVPNIAIDA